MRQQISIFAFSMCALISLTKVALGDIIGRVSQVEDGDTFDICVLNTCVTVRLCGINAPEKGETGYFQAKQALIEIADELTVHCIGIGDGSVCDGRSSRASEGNLVAQCFAGTVDIGEAMVSKGFACDWTKYSGGYYSRRGGKACED